MKFSIGRAIYINVLIVSFTLITMGLELSGCSTVPKQIPLEVKLDVGDNGKEIRLKKGQILVVSLESNPTTGFGWEAEELKDGILRLVSKEYKSKSEGPDGSPPMVGVGGIDIFRFEVANTGNTSLKLFYHRSWENVEPAKTYSVPIVVEK